MQAEPKDHRLFHYTARVDHLRDMLTNGLWPRYCVEEFDWLLGHYTHMAFPVVCFCDIPIPAASSHRERYGCYSLAINKTSAGKYDINPVWYIQDGTSIQKHLATHLDHPIRVTLDTIPTAFKPILPFLKSTIGAQPDRQATRPGTIEILPFEEELEWRHSPPNLSHTWKFGYTRDIVTPENHLDSIGHRVLLSHDDIESVFVPNQSDIDELTGEFPTLLGKIQLWPQ